jgi:glycosyltransferase involved in cell wall biosynthesis
MNFEFSIIIPIYKCKFFERAINSVRNQKYKKWELIIIDNNFDDSVKQFLRQIQDNRIKYYKISNHGVIGKSRNLGIKKSKNEWLCFLDSDDYWSSNKLNETLKVIKKKKYDLIHHNMYVDKDSIKIFKSKLYDYKIKNQKIKFDDLILNGNNIIQSSVVVKKKILKKAKYFSSQKKLIAWEDFDLWLKIAKITNKFYLINKCLGSYYVSKDKNKKLKRFVKNIHEFKKKYRFEISRIKNKYNIKNIWWVEYAEAINLFKEKKYQKSYLKIKKIKTKNFKIKLRTFYLKLVLNLKA